MTAGDLHRIPQAFADGGPQRFLFHNQAHLTAGEWQVISRWCGIPWSGNPKGYWPPATPCPESF